MCREISLLAFGNIQAIKNLQAIQSQRIVKTENDNSSVLGNVSAKSNISDLLDAIRAVNAPKRKIINANIPDVKKFKEQFFSGKLDPRKIKGGIHHQYLDGTLDIYVVKNPKTGKKDKVCFSYHKNACIIKEHGQQVYVSEKNSKMICSFKDYDSAIKCYKRQHKI